MVLIESILVRTKARPTSDGCDCFQQKQIRSDFLFHKLLLEYKTCQAAESSLYHDTMFNNDTNTNTNTDTKILTLILTIRCQMFPPLAVVPPANIVKITSPPERIGCCKLQNESSVMKCSPRLTSAARQETNERINQSEPLPCRKSNNTWGVVLLI